MSFTTSQYIFIGSDAGYTVFVPGKGFKHVGGWGIEQLAEVRSALQVMSAATRFKTPGLADSATKSVAEFVGKELNAHLGEAGGAAGAAGAATVIVVTAV